MTNEEAKKMLKAKLECLKRETSGTDIDCNYHNCDECSLCYEQGNMGEQKEALDLAIKVLEQTKWIPCSERLPEREGWYLTSLGDKTYGDADVDMYCKGWVKYGTHVLAWMPLPQPYKAENEKNVCKDCYYNDGEVHAECVICNKAESEDKE